MGCVGWGGITMAHQITNTIISSNQSHNGQFRVIQFMKAKIQNYIGNKLQKWVLKATLKSLRQKTDQLIMLLSILEDGHIYGHLLTEEEEKEIDKLVDNCYSVANLLEQKYDQET